MRKQSQYFVFYIYGMVWFKWFKKIRKSFIAIFILSIFVNIGMWFERFVIIVTSLHRDFLPSAWTMFSPSFVDIGIYLGTIGFFFVLFLMYARTFPVSCSGPS